MIRVQHLIYPSPAIAILSAPSRPAIQKLQAASKPAEAGPAGLFPAGLVAEAEFRDVDELTATIKNWNHRVVLREPPLAERRRTAHRARQYMVLNMDSPLTIKDICQAIHASERTLHLGFRETFDMTPKRFLKSLRLNAIRRDLLRASPDETVTTLACRWGFFHFSYFAADYRRQFGEFPSETLRRSRSLEAQAT